MKGKDTVSGNVMCIELMEIGARDRTYGASIVIEFSTGGEGRGGGEEASGNG